MLRCYPCWWDDSQRRGARKANGQACAVFLVLKRQSLSFAWSCIVDGSIALLTQTVHEFFSSCTVPSKQHPFASRLEGLLDHIEFASSDGKSGADSSIGRVNPCA